MKKPTKLLVCAFLICVMHVSTLRAQENTPSNLSFGADMVSRYVWRGLNLGGSSPHIQPFIEYSFGETGLSIGAWGSYSLGLNAGTEADLYLSYAPVDWLNITFTDYFFPQDIPFERSDYFNYKEDETVHTFEAMVTVGGSDDIPFYATFAINLYGADGINEKGENYNAKYIEAGYLGNYQDFEFALFAGFAPDDPKTEAGGMGWYSDKPGLINLGISLGKDVEVAGIIVPVFSSLIFNPEAGNIFIVAGLSF